MSLQGSALFRVTPALSIRPMAYYNTFDELTNGYDNARYDSQNNYQSFSQDAHTRIAGTGAQILYRMGESLLTVAVDGHQEGYDANGFEVSLTGDRDPIDTTKTIETVSASAEQELKFSDRLTAVIGAGYAEQLRETASDSDYTYLAGTRYVLTETTALRGSVARKIRFPTLRDLYDVASGNPDLETEVTQNYEFAIEQELPALATFLTIALYRTDAENFIEKQDGIYQNVEQMRMQGVETTARYTGIEALTLEAGYTFLDAKNTSPDAATEVLQQRPEHKFTLAAAYRFDWGMTVTGDLLYVAGSKQLPGGGSGSGEYLDLDDYTVINTGIAQDIFGTNAQMYGRVENVFDTNYVESFGFEQPGRTFYGGLRAKF